MISIPSGSRMNYSKTINDPIHGHLELDDICVSVIDTPQFQRLRELKQTGVAYYVFPGSSHNRFEHSIGVCHLAGQMIDRLRKEQPELRISDMETKCIRLAGLCHDLGHGPFSHLFDSEFIPRSVPGVRWSHEKASEDMLDYMVQENALDISPEELIFIKDLIHGEARSDYPQAHRKFLFEIVANKRNSIDVDKFDYIQRDCANIGVKSSVDPSRIMASARVVNDQICFNQKDAFNIYELFQTRYSLFKRVYTHKVAKAIEFMITDAFLLADPILHISTSVFDMKEYLHMTDTLLRIISASKDPGLQQARNVLQRLARRDLYRFVDQVTIPFALQEMITKEQISPEAISRYFQSYLLEGSVTVQLDTSDVIVEWLTLSFALKDRNPLDFIGYYTKYAPNTLADVKRDQISAMITDQFKEVVVRVYVRDSRKTTAVQSAFRGLLAELNEELGLGDEVSVLEAEGFGSVPNSQSSAPSLVHDQGNLVDGNPNGNGFETPQRSPSRDTHNSDFLSVGTPLQRVSSLTMAKSPSPSKPEKKLEVNRALTLPPDFDKVKDSPRKRKRMDRYRDL